jgi:hypothetical protein
MLYLISWIVVGNYSLLNLFDATLLHGFTEDEVEEDDEEDDKNKPHKVYDEDEEIILDPVISGAVP